MKSLRADELTIQRLAPRIAQGELSPVDIVETMLERVKVIDPNVNAYITVLADQARRQAEDAERRIKKGEYLGELHGIPVALKDIIHIRGVRSTAGSKILADFVPDEDATVVEKLRAAGAIFLGTTNLHEFASGTTSLNPHYGPCRNPWDTARVSGGSSGGSAASVSCATAVASLGSDTSGSIRIPASLCGVFGLKPTYGRVSKEGVLPLCWSLDHVGPITRTAYDAAAMLKVIAGHDRKDESSVDADVPDYTKQLLSDRKLTVGILKNYFMDTLHPEVEKIFWNFVKKLESLGFETIDILLEQDHLIYDSWRPIRRAEASALHQRWLRERPQDYGDDVRRMLEDGMKISAVDYINGQRDRKLVLQDFLRVLNRVDVIVTPTIMIPAPKIGETQVTVGDKSFDIYTALNLLTLAFNITGLPVMTIPVGLTADGLPVGGQIAGKPFDESTILRAAYEYERAEHLLEKFTPPLAKN